MDAQSRTGGRRERHRVHPLAGRRARPDVRRLSRPVALVGHRPGRLLAGGLGLLRHPGVRAGHRGPRPPCHAGRRMVPRRAPQLRRAHPAPGTDRRPRRGRAAVRRRDRPAAGPAVGDVRGPGADLRHPAARHGRPPRRPGRRLSAEHPADRDRHARDGQHRRDLGQLLPRLRLARGHRPVPPAHAEGAGVHRRVPVWRPRLRPARGDGTDRRRPARPGARHLPAPAAPRTTRALPLRTLSAGTT